MKNQDNWRPTKYVTTRRGLRASADPREVSAGSRLTADLQAQAYEKALKTHCRGAVLDLGCGKAPLYSVYKPLASSICCVDWEESCHDISHADVRCDIGAGLPLASEQFHTVVLTDVLEHVAHPAPLWSEIYRVLQPAGKVILGVPFLYWVHEEPHDYHRYTRYKLAGFCENVGLEVVLLEPYGGALEVVLDIVAKHLSAWTVSGRAWYRFSRLVVGLRPWRSLSRRTMEKFPLGYLLVAVKPGAS
ncbi:MAG: class I SAM-dependent methyltransferase [Isosphaeraceae bacterium]|nr:class I SAM-dependent methyltransferase [Isosphaeraceae bacterium]